MASAATVNEDRLVHGIIHDPHEFSYLYLLGPALCRHRDTEELHSGVFHQPLFIAFALTLKIDDGPDPERGECREITFFGLRATIVIGIDTSEVLYPNP
jgi:hypothetical protein